MIVLDTHVFIWCLLDDPQLPPLFRQQVDSAPDKVFIPSVCIWEAMLLAEKGRVTFGKGEPEHNLKKYLQICSFKQAPLTSEIAMLSRTLAFDHNDPADRFIAATAHAMKCKLATSDRNLRTLPWVRLAY